jgi:hypothetical protein
VWREKKVRQQFFGGGRDLEAHQRRERDLGERLHGQLFCFLRSARSADNVPGNLI